MRQAYSGAAIFDGARLLDDHALVLEAGKVVAILPAAEAPDAERLEGGILAPGLIDLQINGGGGLMVDGAATPATFAAICAAHETLGAMSVLPTLITDRPEATRAAIASGVAALGTPGFLGLHLEGPHLDIRRKGAHDPALIRPMQEADLALYCEAARKLPTLMLTLAPASVTPAQIAALTEAGVIVSLGHADCTLTEAEAAIAAGASCATHLFNAMSQLGHREPGLVGATLTHPIACGLIADGIHVSEQAMRIALAAKPEGIFLVSDCMSPAGTDLTEFQLNGRRTLRRDGRLTLEDGTLAGADLTLPQAMRHLAGLGIARERILAMVTSIPAAAIRREAEIGHLAPGRPADLVHLAEDFSLRATWRAGVRTDRPSRP
ncbi:N-acetylglucosamine-6-phosphate deacetylase [Cereibacter changlensis JA139]|uniref:N-acetylglucosamine-6-phosphate deacetylase n=2 Tax=Cereibacter changlensis TaxID=402884 RepID=A0A2T4JXM2_9RHOB|nr:N-acetylglucosamine-6-phosphate deacetylase [Cereibacter changlensis]PTE22672.1 N-acetylglucosamine-6-phosphate deacetylase [Cereibacter changlensis JA139]PZX58947.1 N-acetylglucosamine 6-phosphate deacetylase [Cereibacter changlensis]